MVTFYHGSTVLFDRFDLTYVLKGSGKAKFGYGVYLTGIGVEFITWPYSWKNPDLGLNIAVLDDSKVNILKIQQVELDKQQQLVLGSEKEVSL